MDDAVAAISLWFNPSLGCCITESPPMKGEYDERRFVCMKNTKTATGRTRPQNLTRGSSARWAQPPPTPCLLPVDQTPLLARGNSGTGKVLVRPK